MLDIARRTLRLAERSGARQAEAFVADNTVTTVRIASNRILEAKRVRDSGVGLRVAFGKRVGFASAGEPSAELAERACSMARARPPNPDFNGFPAPTKVRRVRGIYDRKLASLRGERVASIAEEMLESALSFDGRVAEVSGALNIVVERCAIVNTNGVEASDAATRIFGHLTAEARGEERSEGGGWQGSTSLRGFDASSIGSRAAELAVTSLGAEKVGPGRYDIVLEPAAVAELFYHVLSYAVNGREVYDRISYFADKLGKRVASSELNVYDWGNMPEGLYSKAVDDEGTRTRRTPLIKEGKLVGFVYDRYYAGKLGMRSTGNGLRLGDMPGRCYALEPSPHITNLFVAPGDFGHDELIAEMRDGIVLSRIWYTYPITPQIGDFSTTSRCGFVVRNGEIVRGAQQVRIHENLPSLLKRITGVAEDLAQVMPWGADASICAPSLRFSGVQVT